MCFDGIAEMPAVPDEFAVDEDRHVFTKTTSLIDHVTAQAGDLGEDDVEHISNCGPRCDGGWALNVPLQVLRDDHSCHVSNLHLSIGAPPEGQGLLGFSV